MLLKQRLLGTPESDLIGLRAGEEAGEGATAGGQRSRERGPAVSQDGLQVARRGLKSRAEHGSQMRVLPED